MKIAKRIGTALVLTGLTLGGIALAADSKASCTKGRMCKLDSEPASTFKKGEVNGASIWKQGEYAAVWFTSKTGAVTEFDIAVCGADEVKEVLFEQGGKYKDAKTVSPKGKLSGCDNYKFKTARHIDGVLVKPKGNTFKLFIQMDGKPAGFEIHLSQGVLPARDGHWHFKVK